MYGDINVNVEDGNLTSVTNTGTGVQVKIGISNKVSTTPILIKSNMSPQKIVDKLGNSPLADACMDSIENGAKTIYCVPVKISLNGTVSTVAKTGESSGTLEITGTPQNEYSIVIKVTESGNTNEASVCYSINGGETFTEEEIIPLSGELTLLDTGLKAKFTDGEEKENSFTEGTKYEFSTTAPAMSNADIINAAENLRTMNTAFEFVHIVGTTSTALWASISSIANKFLTEYKKPVFFICEGRKKNKDEELDDYVTELEKAVRNISNYYVQVIPSYGTYQKMDGRIQDINLAGIMCGLYCQAKESQSIGEVKSFPISCSKLTKLLPEGIEDYIERLDAARFATIRQYYGKEDYFVTSANMLHPDGSDFRYAEDVRVLNRIIRNIRLKALDELQVEIDPEDIDGSVATLKEELTTPLEDAVEDGIISRGSVDIDTENVNILTDESLYVKAKYVPKGHIREMNVTFAVENPYS